MPGADDKQKDDKKTFSEDYVKELRTENASWRKKLRDVEEKLDRFKDLDLDDYTKLKKEKDEADNKKKLDEGKYNELVLSLKESNKTEIEKLQKLIEDRDKTISNLNASINTKTIEEQISSSANELGAISALDIQLRLNKEIKIETSDDGTRLISILDDSGNKRIDNKGKPLSIKDRIIEMKNDESTAHLFKGGKSGTGTHVDNTDKFKGSPGEMSQVQKAAMERNKLFKNN